MKRIIILLLGLSLTAASCDFINVILGTPGGLRGVYKSADNAETFRPAMALSKGDIGGVSVNSLAFDPTNPEVIYMASGGGVYKSDNAAGVWRYILSGMGVADLVVDPRDSKILYAGGIVGQNGKVIKSFDAGVSWVDIYTEPSKNNPVLALDISPSNSSLLIAGLNNGEIIRSADGGQTWQSSRDFADKIMEVEFASNGTLYALTYTKGLFKSGDNGITWSSASGALANTSLSAVQQSQGSVVNFIQLALDQRQSGVLYLGTAQGLYRSVNNGDFWSVLPLPVRNTALKVTSIAVNPINSNNVIAAVGNTVFKSTNGGVTWETKILSTGAEIKEILINPKTTNVIYLGVGNPR